MHHFCFIGDEIEVEAIEDLICISGLDDHQQQKYRLKHVRYRKYLTVRSRNICLSRRNTNERESKSPFNFLNVCLINEN